MVTPFRPDHGVDLDGAQELASWLTDNGSDSIFVVGSTGESPTLSHKEKADLFHAVGEAIKGKGKLICGTGTYSTAETLELTQAAEDAGADGLLVVTPYYNKPPQRGLIAHFERVADATELPIIVYNIPGRTAVNMGPDLLAELAQIEGIVAVKQANTAEQQPIDGMVVLAGNDDAYLANLEMGGGGCIAVASHIVGPEMRRMYDEPDARAEIDASLRDVYSTLFLTASPTCTKAALNLLGLQAGGLRLPLVPATEEELTVVSALLVRHGLLEGDGETRHAGAAASSAQARGA